MAPKEANEGLTIIEKDSENGKKDTTSLQSLSLRLNTTGSSSNNEQHHYEPSKFEKFLNYILCRNDLSKQTLEAKPVTIIDLFRYAKKFDLFLIFIGLVCATINGIGQPVLSFLGGRIANSLIVYQVNSTEFVTTAYENVYYLAGLSCLIMITNFLQFICFQQCCIRMISKMRHEYMRSILRQNAAWFDKNHSGTLSVKLNDDMERIQEGVGDKLGLLFRGAVMFIAALGISFISDWRLTLVMSAIVPATCICMSIMARKMTATTDKELESVGEAGAIAEESLMGVRTVQAFNGQQEMVDRYGAALEQGKYHAIWKGFWSGFLGAIFFFILFIFLGGGFLYGAYLMNQGLITNVGTVFTVVVSLLIGGYFLGRISPHLMVLLNARVAAAVIYQTIDRVPEIDSYAEDGQVLTNPVGRVVFKDVHFRYPSRNDIMVLKGLNLVVEAGQTVALVGYSGCGKSTSVGLLTRLYESNSGSVTIDGIDVKDMNIKSLRSIVGIVQQEPCLFNDTVAGNLRNGNPDLTYEEMERICKMANADGFIKKLPKGYDTHIGDGGVQLSGGQKQRVAIARTLARDPKILLLDEATSALDAQSEGIVQEALNNASIGRSTIVIAHRLSTVRDADKIVLIEKGRAVEEGTHDQLIARKGMYYELVKAQQFQPETETKENKEDDIPEQLTRFSSYSSELRRSGRDLFIRGNSMNNSFNRSASKRMVDAESEAFAREVQRVMDEDSIMSAGYLDIYKNAIGNYHWLISGVICAICLGLQLPVLSFAYGYEFTVFQEDPSNSKIIRKALIGFLIYIGIGIGIVIFQTLSTVLFVLASENMTLRFRMMSFKNILCQDASYFDNPNHTPGKLIARLASDAPNTKAVIDERAMQLVCELTSLILCICLGTYYQWQIGLLGSCVVLTQFAIMTIIALIVMRKNLEIMTSDDGGIAIETIENVRTIQLLNRTQKFFDVYEEASKHQKRAKLTKGFFEGINFAITQSITCWMLAIGYSLGIYLVHNEIAEQASTFQAVNTMLMSSIAVMNAAPCFPEFIKAKSAASLLFSTIYRQPKTGDADMGDIDELKGEIMFDNVKFSYPQRPHQAVMRSLNFSAEKGQTVALVGPSGSGKSTCISMLERFYDCTSGTLRLDGKDIRSFSLNHLRTQMSLVGQEPRLFAGSIKQNICFGLKNVSTERIVNALKLSNAYTFVNGLPFGLDTEVGEKGAQLSGGQKQRIAIARALVRDPKILLLDEATSALDSESERAVQEALDRAREGRTCITIAHRLSSIQNAHIIVYIENGKVQESGNHTTLMQKRGKYYQLIKKQDLAM